MSDNTEMSSNNEATNTVADKTVHAAKADEADNGNVKREDMLKAITVNALKGYIVLQQEQIATQQEQIELQQQQIAELLYEQGMKEKLNVFKISRKTEDNGLCYVPFTLDGRRCGFSIAGKSHGKEILFEFQSEVMSIEDIGRDPFYKANMFSSDWELEETEMVFRFNSTVGREKGIFVYMNNHGNVRFRGWQNLVVENNADALKRHIASQQNWIASRQRQITAQQRMIERLSQEQEIKCNPSVEHSHPKPEIDKDIQKGRKPDIFNLKKEYDVDGYRYVPVAGDGKRGEFAIIGKIDNELNSVMFSFKKNENGGDLCSYTMFCYANVSSCEDWLRAETEMVYRFNASVGRREGIIIYANFL